MKNEFIGNAAKVFSENCDAKEDKSKEKEMEQDRNELLAKVGQLTIEVDWLKKNLHKGTSGLLAHQNAILGSAEA